MKIRNTILSLLLFGGGLAQAAVWSNSGNGDFNTGSNWDTGIVPTQDKDKEVTIKGAVTVTDSGNRDWFMQNITLSDGANLYLSNGIGKLQGTTITVNSGAGRLVVTGGSTRINTGTKTTINSYVANGVHLGSISLSNVGQLDLNLGLNGSLSYDRVTTAAILSVNMTFALNTGITGPGAIYSFETRTLVDAITNNNAAQTLAIGNSVSAIDMGGQALTRVTDELDLTADAAGLGKYYVYQEANGGDIKVKYVTASVPEPSTAMLGLIGLVALALHRRRK